MKNASIPWIVFAVFLAVPARVGAQAASHLKTSPTLRQNRGPQAHRPAVLHLVTRIVRVPVTVKDTHGNLVADLERADFRIYQDGVRQHISKFWDQPFPVSAVILLDDDLPSRSADQVSRSLDSISAGFGSHDEVAVVRFDEYATTVMGFTNSNDKLFATLKKIRTDPKDSLGTRMVGTPSLAMTTPPRINGQPVAGPGADIPILGTNTNGVTKHLDDAVYYAAKMLHARGPNRRKIIFVITDGTNDRNNKWGMDFVLHELLSWNVSVYAVAVGPRILKFGTGRLSKYASATGGDLFYASKDLSLEQMYNELTEEARNQYMLGFEPSKTPVKGDYHTLEVRVERPDLTVIAPQGYYTKFVR